MHLQSSLVTINVEEGGSVEVHRATLRFTDSAGSRVEVELTPDQLRGLATRALSLLGGKPSPPALPRLVATFIPEKDDGGYCVPAGEGVRFDATEAFLSFSLEEIQDYKERSCYSDMLAEDSKLPEWEAHKGPFEVEADVDGFLRAHGIKNRAFVTQGHLDYIRSLYGLAPVSLKQMEEDSR